MKKSQRFLARPEFVSERVNKRFKESSSKFLDSPGLYLFHGRPEYIFNLLGFSFDTSVIFEEFKKHEKKLRILDIGAGDGQFLLHNRRYGTVYGVTAHLLKKDEDEKSVALKKYLLLDDEKSAAYLKKYLLLGNAEYLLDVVPSGKKFNFIVSAVTFCHLVDPVGAAILAYGLLKPGGILMIDFLPIFGCRNTKKLNAIIHQLKSKGFVAAGEAIIRDDAPGIACFMIKKTEKKLSLEDFSLNIPLKQDSENSLSYSISNSKLGADEDDHDELFFQGYSFIIKSIAEEKSDAFALYQTYIFTDLNFAGLIKDEHYNTLSDNSKILLTLAGAYEYSNKNIDEAERLPTVNLMDLRGNADRMERKMEESDCQQILHCVSSNPFYAMQMLDRVLNRKFFQSGRDWAQALLYSFCAKAIPAFGRMNQMNLAEFGIPYRWPIQIKNLAPITLLSWLVPEPVSEPALSKAVIIHQSTSKRTKKISNNSCAFIPSSNPDKNVKVDEPKPSCCICS